jgi:hypothetical protein
MNVSDTQSVKLYSLFDRQAMTSEHKLLHSILKVLAFKVVLLTALYFAFIKPNVQHVDAQSTAAALGLGLSSSPTSPEGVLHGQ